MSTELAPKVPNEKAPFQFDLESLMQSAQNISGHEEFMTIFQNPDIDQVVVALKQISNDTTNPFLEVATQALAQYYIYMENGSTGLRRVWRTAKIVTNLQNSGKKRGPITNVLLESANTIASIAGGAAAAHLAPLPQVENPAFILSLVTLVYYLSYALNFATNEVTDSDGNPHPLYIGHRVAKALNQELPGKSEMLNKARLIGLMTIAAVAWEAGWDALTFYAPVSPALVLDPSNDIARASYNYGVYQSIISSLIYAGQYYFLTHKHRKKHLKSK